MRASDHPDATPGQTVPVRLCAAYQDNGQTVDKYVGLIIHPDEDVILGTSVDTPAFRYVAEVGPERVAEELGMRFAGPDEFQDFAALRGGLLVGGIGTSVLDADLMRDAAADRGGD